MARRKVATPRAPDSQEREYLRTLRRIWHIAQAIILHGLEPLLAAWPTDSASSRTDARAPRLRIVDPGRTRLPPSGLRGPGVTVWPAGRRDFDPAYSPLAPRSRIPRIQSLSDAQLRRLWPNTDPQDIRRFAPWATTHAEVMRHMMPAGSPVTAVSLEERLGAAIRAKRLESPQDLTPVKVLERRGAAPSTAFRIQELGLGRGIPADALPPVIVDAFGIPLAARPFPTEVTAKTIERQIGWIRLNLGQLITTTSLSPILAPNGEAVSRQVQREMGRVLGIDLRKDVPGLRGLIDKWRDQNVDLIETGVHAPLQRTKLRPSLLADVSRTVEEAHASGARVEGLAGELRKRFAVSDSRAELIARDQVLKLNGEISQYRQRDAGITKYKWVTSRDERVRERHAELDNTIHTWDVPPEVAPGRYCHPGEDFQCRCVAVPVLPDNFGEA